MDPQRFRKLAEELAERDPGLSLRLRDARDAARSLRAAAFDAVEAFRQRAAEIGAGYLGNIEVSTVEPDDKHLDAVQFRVSRGRLELLCVAIARGEGKLRLVGPFKRGKDEGPCAEAGLRGPDVETLLEERIAALLREAAGA
ncbi:MAG: hypothetical protein ACHQ6T_10625 [Myxococcota bacterium]